MFKVWYRDFKVWSRYKGSSLVANLGEPLLYLFAMGFGLGRYVSDIGGVSYAEFLAPGLIMASVMHSASLETTYSSYTRLAIQRTYDSMVYTPLSFKDVVLGEIFWATTKSCFSGITMLLVFTLFGLVKTPLVLLTLPLCFVVGVVFSALGILVTAYARGYEFFNYYLTLFIAPMFLLSGTFFPLDQYSTGLRAITWLLPLTHAVKGARILFQGHVNSELGFVFIWLSLLAVIFSYFAVKKIEKRLYV